MKKIFYLLIGILLFEISYSQESINSHEALISKNIDSVLNYYSITYNDIVNDFDNFLILNDFYSSDNISAGYINFYNYIKCPECFDFEISQRPKAKLLIDTLAPNYGKLLNQYLNNTQIYYMTLQSKHLLRQIMDYSDFVLISGETKPFDFELINYKGEFEKNIYKVFLITVLRNFSNFDYIYAGYKYYDSDFVDTLASNNISEKDIVSIGISQTEVIQNQKNSNDLNYSILKDNYGLNKIAFVKMKFVVNKDGETSNYIIIESSDKKYDEYAINTIKEWEWKAAKYNNKYVDCIITKTIDFYNKK